MFRKILLLPVTAIFFLFSTEFALAGSKKETTALIKSGEYGGIVFFGFKCRFSFTHSISGEKVDGGSYPRGVVEAAKPGLYKVNVGKCKDEVEGQTYVFASQLSEHWFGNVEVKAGEVVYPGSFTAEIVPYEPDSIIRKGGLLSDAPKILPSYSVEEWKRPVKVIKKKYPDLADVIETRLPESRRNKEAVEQIMDFAHAYDANGERAKWKERNDMSELLYNEYVLTGTLSISQSANTTE